MGRLPLALAVVMSASTRIEPEARAEPGAASPGPGESASLVEPPGEPEDPVALAARAEEAFAEGRFDAVVELAARAYALTGDPRHLYAQALAERRLDHCREALILYARVLARVKDDPAYAVLVDGTRQGITLCEERLETQQVPLPRPTPQPPSSEPEADEEAPRLEPLAPPWHRDVLGGVTLGVGLAVGAGAGGVLWGLSGRELRAADRASDEAIYGDALSRARVLRTSAIISVAAGGALVVGAVIRYLLVDRKHRRQTATMSRRRRGRGSF